VSQTPSEPTIDLRDGGREPKGLRGALLRYRVMAFVTGVVLGALTVALVVLWDVPKDERPAWYGLGWVAHGWLYIVYVAASLDLVFRMKWALWRALLVVLAGTIPFMSFVAERWVTHRVDKRLVAPDTKSAAVRVD